MLYLSNCIVLAHGDGDGVCSASLLLTYLRDKCNTRVFFTHPVGLIGDLRETTKPGDNVFIVDIAIDEIMANELVKTLEEYSRQGLVVYIDHHPLPEGFEPPRGIEWVHNTCCSASELTYRYLYEKGLSNEYGRVGLYGAISDYLDETPWVKEELWRWDKRMIYLEAGVLSQGLEGSRRDHEFKRTVVEYLSKNALPSQYQELVARSIKQAEIDENMRIWVKNNLKIHGKIAYVINPPGSIGRAANYARIYGGVEVGLAIEERRDLYVISLRGSGKHDLNTILRKLSRKLGIHGGGHPFAAGARLPRSLFYLFLVELNKMLGED